MTKKATKKKIKKIEGEPFADWPNENPDAGATTSAAQAKTPYSFGVDFNSYRRNQLLKRLGAGLYFATVPFIFGVIVNTTGDYLTAAVVTSSLIMGPVAFKYTRSY